MTVKVVYHINTTYTYGKGVFIGTEDLDIVVKYITRKYRCTRSSVVVLYLLLFALNRAAAVAAAAGVDLIREVRGE